ncbi:hypothetical protein Taro_029443, partial [Colocasia esculenta]|nr:hypothetical protein [Colocasia esculenta]
FTANLFNPALLDLPLHHYSEPTFSSLLARPQPGKSKQSHDFPHARPGQYALLSAAKLSIYSVALVRPQLAKPSHGSPSLVRARRPTIYSLSLTTCTTGKRGGEEQVDGGGGWGSAEIEAVVMAPARAEEFDSIAAKHFLLDIMEIYQLIMAESVAIEIESDSPAASLASPPISKQRKLRSLVWNDFEKFHKEDGSQDKLTRTIDVGMLFAHGVNSDGSNSLKCVHFDEETCRDLLAKNSTLFQGIFNKLQPQFKLVGHTSIKANCMKWCNIAKVIPGKLFDWNLNKKLCSIVLDNAFSNDVLTRQLSNMLRSHGCLLLNDKLFRVRYCCHVLNLIVQMGLDPL